MGANPSLADPENSIILFDGVCNLCSGAVKFVLKRDRKQYFKFAPLQSDLGRHYLQQFGVDQSIETIVLIQEGVLYKKSNAALQIARKLNFPWPLLYALKILPRKFRDFVYDVIARNRYRWFGKSDQCMIPTPEISERFVG